MGQLHAPFEMARGHAQEGHTVAVLWVHIGLHLEDEACHLGLFRGDLSGIGALHLRFRPIGADAVHQLFHPEGVDGRAEPDRRHGAFQHRLRVQRGQQFARHLKLFPQLVKLGFGYVFRQGGVVEPVDLDRFGHAVAVGAVHQL